jgi:hypothetical protein
MDPYKPLRAVLFFYELLRLFFLAASFAVFSSLLTAETGAFPFMAFMSTNALFPMMAFFLCLSITEYRNYLPLYAAGKTVVVVLFYMWIFFSFPETQDFTGSVNYVQWTMYLVGLLFFSLLDGLSILGIWILKRKISRIEKQ